MGGSLVRAPRMKVLCALVASCFAAEVFANPTGPTVVSGSASFNSVGGALTVTNTPNAIINWRGFSIGAGEITRFQQQSASSAVLNRVVGQDPSAILGALWSNGRVFLVNPNGILFGQGSRVDVAGLVASTLNITDGDFLGGRLKFQAGAVANPIVNQGGLHSSSGGHIYLVSPDITNSGLISSPSGEVVLAAGKSVSLVDIATPNLKVEVSAGEGQARNLGQIVADSGRIGVYAGLINQQGIVRADTVGRDATGKIVFKASDTTLLEGGSLTSAAGPKGGEIQVLGNKVGLTGSAQIDASGDVGGGTVLVGGDYRGRNPEVQNALVTYFGPDALIKADAITNGDGGKVIVWADDTTRFYGSITARGGAQSGNGGFVEVSGKNWLDFTGTANTLAPKGNLGTLLLDPTNIFIADSQANATAAGMSGNNSSASTFSGGMFQASGAVQDSLLTTLALSTALTLNNVIVSTDNVSGTGVGNITVVDGFTYTPTVNGNLKLLAHNNITVNGAIANAGFIFPANTISMFAGWDGVDTGSPAVNLGTGDININGSVSSLFGGIALTAGRDINVTGGSVSSSTGTTLDARRHININSGTVSSSSDVSLTALGTITINNSSLVEATSSGSAVTMNAAAIIISDSNSLGGKGIYAGGPEGFGTITLNATNGITISNSTLFADAGSSLAATVSLTAGGVLSVTGSSIVADSSADALITLDGAGGVSVGGGAFINAVAGSAASITLTSSAGNVSVGARVPEAIRAEGTTTAGILLQSNATNGTVEVGGNVLADAGLSGAASINISAPLGAITSVGGGILQSPSTAAEIGLSAMKGIGTIAKPIRVDSNNIDVAASNSGASPSGDIAVSFANGNVNLVPGDLSLVLNANPIGTYLVKAEAGNILLSTTFTPNNANLVAGQSVVLTAPAGNVTLDSSGTILATGTGNVTLEAGNHLLISGAGTRVSGNNVTFLANDMDIAGAVTATTSATLAPFDLVTNMTINGNSLGCGLLCLGPMEIQQVSAPILTLGRSDSNTNIFYLDQALSSGNYNVAGGTGLLRIRASAIYENGSGGIGGPFDHSLELRAGGNIDLALNSIILANNNNLTILAGQDFAGNLNVGAVTLQVGTGANTGSMTLQGQEVNVVVSGGGSGLLQVTGTGAQNISALSSSGTLRFENANNATGTLTVQSGGAQTLSAAGDLDIVAGTGTNTNVRVQAGGQQIVTANSLYIQGGNTGSGNSATLQSLSTASNAQSVSATGITLLGGADGGGLGVGNVAFLVSAGSQSITAGSGGLTLTARGNALSSGTTDNAAIISQQGLGGTQTITVNSGGNIVLTGGHSPLTAVGTTHGSRALIEARGTSQTINFTAGGAMTLTAGTTGSRNYAQIFVENGSQTITGASALTMDGGTSGGIDGEGNFARIYALGTQTLSLSSVRMTGGSGGSENFAQILQDGSSGTQTITVPAGGIQLKGGTGGGGFDTGNFAQIRGNGTSQILNVTGGMLLQGGGGTLTDNFASVFQSLASGTQTINMNGGGTLDLRGGSSQQSGIGTVSGHGSFAFITGDGTAQNINFASGGTVDIRGGTVGSRNNAGILSRGGSQSILGSPDIFLTGGASGGVADEGNSASIQATAAAGTQFIEAGTMSLQAGAAGINNFAVIQAPIQDIFVTGNLSLAGGGSSASANSGGGARIGGLGGTSAGPTDLVLIVDGNLTMTGGSVAGAGTSIGSGINGGQTTNIEIDVGNNVTLNPGTVADAGSRIGSPASNMAGGDISIIAGGNVTVNGDTAIRTLGALEIDAGGALTLTGSNSGVGQNALVFSGGDQTIIAGSIALAGGAAGGADLNGNFARLVSTGGVQTIITSGDMTLTAGAAGINNYAVIQAPTQFIFVDGNLSLTGGGSSASLDGTTGGGARIGGLGGAGATATNLQLIVTNNVTMTGGSVANAGASIGSNLQGGQPTTITMDVGGNVTLNPGTVALSSSRIGSPAAPGMAGGDISITAGGTIALNSNPGLGTFIRTLGNVTLNAASITQGADSAIIAGGTTALTGGTISLGSASNDFTGAVDIFGTNVTIKDVNTLTLGSVEASNLTAAASTIAQNSSGIDVTGTTNLSGGTIALNTGTNDFATVNVTSTGNVAITDANAITIGSSSVGGTFDVVGTSVVFSGGLSATNYSFSGGNYTLSTGTYNLGGTTTVASTATVTASGATINAGTVNVSGVLDASGGSLTGSINLLAGGMLKGTGTITGSVTNTAGTVSPGASPGTLTITGNYVQGPSGVLDVQIGGLVAGTEYDQLLVSGTATLGGTLNTSLINGFVPVAGNSFTFVQAAGGVTGAFTTINQPVGALFNSFYNLTSFEFVAAIAGAAPAPIEPTFNYVATTTDQVLTELTSNLTSPSPEEEIVIAPIVQGTTPTAEGTVAIKPPACN